MEANWPSEQTVNVLVTFALIGGKDVLANGGGVQFARSSVLDELLPIAAAEAIDNENKNGNSADLEIVLNQGATWYAGVDASAIPATSYDFITVMLHEIYHNLIFSGRLFVDVALDPKAPGGVLQTARFTTGDEPTRFDKFASNTESCQVLGYRNASSLATSTKKTTDQLWADSLTNGKLFFASADSAGPLAKLYSPRIWIPKSSLYHLDPSVTTDPNDAIMHPQIAKGAAIRSVGIGILNIQVAFLNNNVDGAKVCDVAALVDPTPGTPPNPNERAVPASAHGEVSDRETGAPAPAPGAGSGASAVEPRRIGGMRVWVFALVVTFSILGGLLLIGLCIFLILTCLKARKKGKGTYDEYDDGYDNTTRETEEDSGMDVEQGEVVSGNGESDGTVAESGDFATGEGPPEGTATGTGDEEGSGGTNGVPPVLPVPVPLPGDKDKGKNGDEEEPFFEDISGGSGKKRSKKSSKKGSGGKVDSDEFPDSSRDGGGMGPSVCPSTRSRKHKPCAPPKTFDHESVPSASSHRRNGSAPKSSLKKSRSGKSYSGSSAPGSDSYYGDSVRSGSKKCGGAGPGVKPGSVCPPTTAVGGGGKPSSRKGSSHRASSVAGGSAGEDGGPFDCETQTMDPFDCDTIFDCENVSKKTATKFRVSDRPIPKVINPTTGNKSRLLYLDSETTDSTHLRPYERGSAQKDPVGLSPKTAVRKQPMNHPPKVKPPPRLAPMSMAPSSSVPSEAAGSDDCKIPSTKVPARKNTDTKTSHRSKRSRTQPSSYYTSDCSCSECLSEADKRSCDYGSASGSYSKHPSCKASSTVPSSCDVTCDIPDPPKKSKSCKKSEAGKSESGKSCKRSEGGKSSCKKSSSRKSIHSEGGKSSCKRSRSRDGKENTPSNGKSSSKCSRSKSKDSIHRSSSCKKSNSEKSIKSSKSKDCKAPPTCQPPPPSCKPTSDFSSDYDFETKSELPKLKSTCPPSEKEKSSCPPTEPEKVKSTCPTSEKKTATRYHGSSKHHRRRREQVTTKVTTKQTMAKYEDGKLVDKRQKAKETTKKYQPVTEDSSSMYYDDSTYLTPTYTSSYFMSEEDDTTVKPEKKKRSHSHHSKSSRHHRSESRHKSRHGDGIRRSKSEKDIVGVRYGETTESRHRSRHDKDGLTRASSGKDLRRSKSQYQLSSRYVTQVQPPMTRETRRTDIHSVALDPEVTKKYKEEKSRRESEKRSRRERSTRHHERERERDSERRDKSSYHERETKHERRDKSPYHERETKYERREKSSPHHERGTVVKKKRKEVTTTKVRVGKDSTIQGISEPTTTDFPTTWNTSDDSTSFRWSDDITTTRTHTKRRERSRSRSRPRIQATAMPAPSSAPPSSSTDSTSVMKSSCPPTSSAESSTVQNSSCPPSSSRKSSSIVKSSCPPSTDKGESTCGDADVKVKVECSGGKKPKVKYTKKGGIKVSVTVKD